MPSPQIKLKRQSDCLVPRHGKLYLCRYGWNGGKQVALFLGYSGDGYVVRKWRTSSRRWTAQIVVAKGDLLAKATADDYETFCVNLSRL